MLLLTQVAAVSMVMLGCSRESRTLGSGTADPVPRRIVALAPNAVEIVCELGVGDRLVGVSGYTVYPPQVRHLPRIGGLRDPELETIFMLAPDLVILRGRQENVEKLCRDRGIAIYHDPTNTLAELYGTITELGRILDRRRQAEALCQRIRKHLEQVRRKTAGRPRVKVLLTMRSPDRLANISTVAKGSYLHELIELAGGDNTFGDLDVAYPQISIEEIVARGPEVIIEAMPGKRFTCDEGQLVEQWRQLGPIPAVRNRRIHVITDDYVLIPSPRLALLAEKLLGLLHPGVANDG